MKSYQVIRTHISPYQSQDFLHEEKLLLEGISGVTYRSLDDFRPSPTVLITNTHTDLRVLNPELLRATELIIHPNSGYDNFVKDSKSWENIPLVVGHPIRAQAVAEYTLSAIFQWVVDIPQHLRWDKSRKWDRKLISELPIWIFGQGHIGTIIGNTLRSLGAEVTYVDPFKPNSLRSWKDGKLKEAKIVIAACGLNETSREIFNSEFFNSLSRDVLFINGARGKLVNEEALKDYLLSNPEAFAYLDVFQNEPFAEEWLAFPQVSKTSHIAGVEKNLDQRILDFESSVLRDFISSDKESFLKKYSSELLQNRWVKGILI